ncbi:MAG: tryptophan synthase subunit beta [Proteobacteria bacterium]|nr:tryptophan synthase subunit beta [Pseudomonadota bacterium]MBU1685900.1 tryptophan synthase subunit beta [Pseudomonadota bacterium]
MTNQSERIFVRRDDLGQIVEVSLIQGEGFEPRLLASDQDRTGLLNTLTTGKAALSATDLHLVRVLEDLIDLLIGKGVICLSDLPEVARHKLLERQTIRSELQGGLDLLIGEEDII